MATWVIGDIHGCYDSLRLLWKRLDFNPEEDKLWLTGDLVNRGPKSLEVLRWAKKQNKLLDGRMKVVLGNHDLHLLAVDRGINPIKKQDTLDAILDAPDRKKLLKWLRSQSFVHRDGRLLLVHAGLFPAWKPKQAEKRSRRLEAALGTKAESLVLASKVKASKLTREVRSLRRSCYSFTLLRTCTEKGKPCSHSGPPELAPAGCQAWYRLWDPAERDVTVICGHWAAQGFKMRPGMIALDSGCVWGGGLTAVRVEDLKVVQQRTVEKPKQLP